MKKLLPACLLVMTLSGCGQTPPPTADSMNQTTATPTVSSINVTDFAFFTDEPEGPFDLGEYEGITKCEQSVESPKKLTTW